MPFPEKNYIYFEGDDVQDIFFLIKGKAGFVLPKYQNTTYIDINVGAHFGIIDIVESMLLAQILNQVKISKSICMQILLPKNPGRGRGRKEQKMNCFEFKFVE